jgi:hypothetical protein
MTERVLVDSWTVETASRSQTTEVYPDAKFTLLVRDVVKDDGDRQVSVVPFTHGEDLQRHIAAQQAAAAYPGKRA